MSVKWLVMKTFTSRGIETFKCANYARTECEFLNYNNFNLVQSLTVTVFLFFHSQRQIQSWCANRHEKAHMGRDYCTGQ